jgi:hypothetical protein
MSLRPHCGEYYSPTAQPAEELSARRTEIVAVTNDTGFPAPNLSRPSLSYLALELILVEPGL